MFNFKAQTNLLTFFRGGGDDFQSWVKNTLRALIRWSTDHEISHLFKHLLIPAIVGLFSHTVLQLFQDYFLKNFKKGQEATPRYHTQVSGYTFITFSKKPTATMAAQKWSMNNTRHLLECLDFQCIYQACNSEDMFHCPKDAKEKGNKYEKHIRKCIPVFSKGLFRKCR